MVRTRNYVANDDQKNRAVRNALGILECNAASPLQDVPAAG
jgi:hypothetical protein